MKIALVTRSFSWHRAGGGEIVTRLLAEGLRKLGHDVVVLAVDAPDEPGIVRLRALRVLEVRAALRRVAPDVVDAHNMESAPAAVLAARSLGIPVVVTVNSAWAACIFADMYVPGVGICETCWVGGVKLDFERRPPEVIGRRVPAIVGYAETRRRLAILRMADLLVAHSGASRDLLVRNGVPPALVRVTPNMDEPAFHRSGTPEPGRILFAGGLTHPKGADTVLEAFVRLARPGTRLVLAGDGYLRTSLAKRAKDAGVADRVDLLGHVPRERLQAEYGRASIVVFASRAEETFGRILLEAWGARVPLAASRVSAPGELVRDGETGLHFDPEDAASLAAVLARLLDDAQLRARLVENGAKELARYHPDVVIPQFVAGYEEAMR